MAFGNITTFYLPTSANAGTSQWGTNVRKLLSSADAGSDTTTIMDHGTSGTPTRTADPYLTNNADDPQANFGWAITPSDMGGSAGARRFIPAGTHTATIRMAHNGLAAATQPVWVYVYKVGTAAASRARTLIASQSTSVTYPAVSGQVTAVLDVVCPEIIFEPDETLQYSFETVLGGITLLGHTATLMTGTNSSVESRIVTPGLKVLADTTGSAAGGVTATGLGGKVLGTIGASSGLGSALGTGASRADTVGTAAGAAAVAGVMSSVAGTVGTAAGLGIADGKLGAIGSMIGSAAGTGAAVGVLGAIGGMVGSAAGSSAAQGVLGAIGGMVGSAAGAASVVGLGSSVAGTIGNAAGAGAANGVGGKVLGTVGTVEIGSGTPAPIINIYPQFLFDD